MLSSLSFGSHHECSCSTPPAEGPADDAGCYPLSSSHFRFAFRVSRSKTRIHVSAEWACKPDPVAAPPFRTRRPAIIPLAPRLPAGSSDLPGGFGRASLDRPPIWSCSVWGLPCPSCHHAGGALLPHLFTLATLGLSTGVRRCVFCGTFPGVAPAGR